MPLGTKNETMQYRKVGATDLEVSLLGFGTSPQGNVYGAIDPVESTRAVHLAIDHGINYFDASPYYGLTLAEERLGQALVGKREQVVLATKCGRYGVDSFDFSAKRIKASVDESLCRLRTDYIDLLQAHDVEFATFAQITEETIPAMREIQKQGKARFIGITGFPMKMLVRIATAVPVDSILSYCRYNLLVADMDTVLTPFTRERGIGLINASGLHMGVLTARGGPDWHPAPPEVRAAAKRAAAVCERFGADLSRVAIRFCFDHPYVASTLVGMTTRDEVQTNLKLQQAKSDPELLKEIRAAIGPNFNAIWPSGRPENND
jgi:L-galactose dehydrogenase